MSTETLEVLNRFEIKADDQVFVVHAHPDDESVSTGGAIMHLAKLGAKIHGISGSDGENSTKAPLFSKQRKRIGELHNSYALLGNVPKERVHRLRLPDGNLSNNVFLAALGISKLIELYRPSIFITPGPTGFDFHPDHIAMHEATMLANRMAAEIIGSRAVIWALTPYEPGDIEIEFDKQLKLDAVLLNESQFPSNRALDGGIIMTGRAEQEINSYGELIHTREVYNRIAYPYV